MELILDIVLAPQKWNIFPSYPMKAWSSRYSSIVDIKNENTDQKSSSPKFLLPQYLLSSERPRGYPTSSIFCKVENDFVEIYTQFPVKENNVQYHFIYHQQSRRTHPWPEQLRAEFSVVYSHYDVSENQNLR